MAFPSVYEMTNPLTTVRKQHFWEYFSGADDTVITTKTYNQADTGRVSTRSLYSNPTVSNGEGERVAVRVDAGHSAIGTTVNKVKVHIARRGTLSGNYEVTIRDGSDTILASASATANNVSTSYSTVELTLDNYVVMVAGYRVCIEYDSTARTANGLDFGTSSPAWESNITQQLYSTAGGWINDPDGAGAGRKFMFTFDSTPATSLLPPYRWTFTEINATATGAMADEVDGGYAISTTASADRGSLSFNNIRPFSFNSSVLISTMKRTGSTGEVCITGFVEDKSNSNSASYDHAIIRDREADTYKKAFTGNGTTSAGTDTTFAVNADWTTYKIELTSSNAYFYVNGAIGATRTGTAEYLPLTKLQPMFWGEAGSGGSGKASIKYMECYNT